MFRSPAASALLILTLLIASEVSSAPREEFIPQEFNGEKFMETREAEFLERHSRRNEKFGETKEDEVRHRPTRLVKEYENESNEKYKVEKRNGTSEANDMIETFAPPRGDDDSINSKKTLTIATDNDNKKPVTLEVSGNKNTTGNATNVAVDLPPKLFPEEGVRNLNNATEEEYLLLTHNKTNGEVPNATVNESNNTKSSIKVLEITSATIGSTVSITVSSTTAVTTETSTITSTTQPSVPTIKTSTITAPTESIVVATEKSTINKVVTDGTITAVFTEPSNAELKLHSKKLQPMPSGIVVLITTIAFAIVAVTAYVGLLGWRRYLEWRYGNRELLVNDFDANDFGNFEL